MTMPEVSESRPTGTGASQSFILRQFLESKTVASLKWDAEFYGLPRSGRVTAARHCHCLLKRRRAWAAITVTSEKV